MWSAPGQSYMQTAEVDGTPEEVVQRFVRVVVGMPGYSFNAAEPNSLVVSRRYVPTWAIVVAVVGFLFIFVFALPALLVKNTETLTITATSTDTGSKVQINGVAKPELVARLNTVIVGTV